MLTVLEEAIQHRLVLPLVIAAPEDETVLYPDAAARQMEARVDECFPEIEAFRIGMEHIRRCARTQKTYCRSKSIVEELVELLIFHAVVLDGQSGGTFEGYSVRRIRQQQIGFLSVHECGDIVHTGGIATHEPVPSDRPDIALLHEGCLFQRGGEIEVIVFRVVIVGSEEICELLIIEAGEHKIKVRTLQRFDFHA